MKVYILTESSGQYEDHYVKIVGVYSTKEKVEAEKNIRVLRDINNEKKFLEQEKILNALDLEWHSSLKEKNRSEGMSQDKLNEKYNELFDKIECYDNYYEHHWYDIKEFELK